MANQSKARKHHEWPTRGSRTDRVRTLKSEIERHLWTSGAMIELADADGWIASTIDRKKKFISRGDVLVVLSEARPSKNEDFVDRFYSYDLDYPRAAWCICNDGQICHVVLPDECHAHAGCWRLL